jgi:hypothetical protein
MEESYLDKDCIGQIAEYITDGVTWKGITQTCHALYEMNTKDKINKYANHLMTLLGMYPNESWDFSDISNSPRISYDFVLTHLELRWDWLKLSTNPALSFDFVSKHPELPWNWARLSCNPNLSFDFVLAYPDPPGGGWDWLELSRRPSLSFNFVLAHPELPWNWYGLSYNPNLTFDFIVAHPEFHDMWKWTTISNNRFGRGEFPRDIHR